MSTILLTDFCRVVVDHPEVRIERAHTVEPLDAMGRPSKRAGETVWRVVGYYADVVSAARAAIAKGHVLEAGALHAQDVINAFEKAAAAMSASRA